MHVETYSEYPNRSEHIEPRVEQHKTLKTGNKIASTRRKQKLQTPAFAGILHPTTASHYPRSGI